MVVGEEVDRFGVMVEVTVTQDVDSKEKASGIHPCNKLWCSEVEFWVNFRGNSVFFDRRTLGYFWAFSVSTSWFCDKMGYFVLGYKSVKFQLRVLYLATSPLALSSPTSPPTPGPAQVISYPNPTCGCQTENWRLAAQQKYKSEWNLLYSNCAWWGLIACWKWL